jgi:hypothetical protein
MVPGAPRSPHRFVVSVPRDERDLTAGLRAIRRHEAALGLDRWPRVCMRRDL